MALKEIVKGICDVTRCKYDVYTKEKMDELLEEKANSNEINEIYTKNNFAVIEGSLEGLVFQEEQDQCAVSVNYPEGFTWQNCVVVSTEINPISDTLDNNYMLNVNVNWIDWQHGVNDLILYVKSSTPRKDWSTYKYRVVLFKHKD
jgi:hypothetical protein